MNKEEILAKLASGEIPVEEASKLLSQVEDQRDRRALSCKVSVKGALSVYGLQRMPVTLYAEQWERLLGFGDEIRKFLQEHHSELDRKNKPAGA